ncbi:hypothetical protein HYH03_013420 [Edaphochlamys debaryana]|uniref:AB hydrolase-1 domain-containing protein n=1 Tax=Edaphochlamys debaryana TaxID=47281 RepID=A0A835XQW0_9CHLO|nr:hypothetical protein HYH03_013420 [Edaphochlamys debaryana]|eukprot:KAG2487980.1 hypothetical protein HYH03_013420 [Edaphochlamys debaryana]
MPRLSVVAHELGGTGPLLLLLHANGFHGRVFLPMVPTLSQHFCCVALDLPGHGDAPAPDGPFTEEELVAAVVDFADARGLRGAYCLGHSLGGCMGLMLQLARPGAMFLYEPVVFPTRGYVRRYAAARAAGEAQRESALARMARKRQASAGGGGWGVKALYPSVAAAKASLGSKPPFSAFAPQALHAYLACGGLRPVTAQGPEAAGAGPSPVARPGAGPGTIPGPTPAPALTLACSPEAEARVYEALDPPPWRPWERVAGGGAAGAGAGPLPPPQQPPAPSAAAAASAAPASAPGPAGACCSRCCPGAGSGAGAGACGRAAAGGEATVVAAGGEGGPGPTAGGGPGPGQGGSGRGVACRVCVAAGATNAGVHGRLAAMAEELATVIPGAVFMRFPSLHHLGPMEDPEGVARAAAAFLLGRQGGQGQERQGGAGAGRGTGAGAGDGPQSRL